MPHQIFSGRPLPRLDLVIVFGLLAIQAYMEGQRDRKILNQLGRVCRQQFETVEELNAYLQGIEDCLGFHDVHFDDQAPGP